MTNYSKISHPAELGAMIRKHRKSSRISIQTISGLTCLGMRFISEAERGKETAEIGKIIQLIESLGLELWIFPRGQMQNIIKNQKETE